MTNGVGYVQAFLHITGLGFVKDLDDENDVVWTPADEEDRNNA